MALKCTGFIETLGLAAAIEAADTAVKSANVKLIGYEYTKGDGMCTVKIEGDVGAVKAAIAAASISAAKVWGVYSTDVIARPAAGIDMLIHNADATIGYEDPEPASASQIKEPAEDTKEEIKKEIESAEEAKEETEEEVKSVEDVKEQIEEVKPVEDAKEPIEEIQPAEDVKPEIESAEGEKEEVKSVEDTKQSELKEPVEDETPAKVQDKEVPKETPRKTNSRRRRTSGKNPKGNNNEPKNE